MINFGAKESTANDNKVVWESEGPLRLNPRADSADVACMHSWVFRHRKRLHALYGPQPLRSSATSAPTDTEAVRERCPGIERKPGGEVILHPAAKPAAQANPQSGYRRGA